MYVWNDIQSHTSEITSDMISEIISKPSLKVLSQNGLPSLCTFAISLKY